MDSILFKLVEALVEIFSVYCSPQKHREWEVGAWRVTIEMNPPTSKIYTGEVCSWEGLLENEAITTTDHLGESTTWIAQTNPNTPRNWTWTTWES
jgi:hypothetical protein